MNRTPYLLYLMQTMCAGIVFGTALNTFDTLVSQTYFDGPRIALCIVVVLLSGATMITTWLDRFLEK